MKKSILSLLLGMITLIQARADEIYPVVILGGGVGALTSALYLGRSGISPLLVEGANPGGALAQSPRVQNWPGEIEISGLDLIEKMHAQAQLNGTHFLQEEVINVDFQQRPFTITTRNLFDPTQTRKILANACVVATGSKPNFLNIPGENTYWTRGVYNCAVCDGALYKDQVIAIVGGGDAAVLEAEHLAHIGKKIYLIVRKDSFRAKEELRVKELLTRSNVEVLFNTTVQEVRGDGHKVSHLILNKNGTRHSLDVNALFLAIGAKPNSELFQGQLEMDSQGYVVLKKDQETSVKGVFAIGDIVDPTYKQAVIAAGQGAIASCQVVQSLGSKSVKDAPVASAPVVAEPPLILDEVIEIVGYEHFKREVKNANLPVIVDFYATWCGPCKTLSPLFAGWAKEYAGKVKFLKVNVDRNNELVQRYGIASMPTVILVDKTGKSLAKKVGGQEIALFMKKFDPEKVK